MPHMVTTVSYSVILQAPCHSLTSSLHLYLYVPCNPGHSTLIPHYQRRLTLQPSLPACALHQVSLAFDPYPHSLSFEVKENLATHPLRYRALRFGNREINQFENPAEYR